MTTDFRQKFDKLAPQAIVSRTELAELLNTTQGAISQMVYRGELPKTAFPSKRRCCWFVRDIRLWLDGQLNLESELPQSTSNRFKVGRPRSTVETIK